jgi:hypothetical protein
MSMRASLGLIHTRHIKIYTFQIICGYLAERFNWLRSHWMDPPSPVGLLSASADPLTRLFFLLDFQVRNGVISLCLQSMPGHRGCLSFVVQLVELGFHGGGGGRLAPKGIIKS